ncbi:MAG: DUF4215 domain-containing protein [Myxococcota bacterium]
MSSLIFGVACGDDDGGGTDAEVEMGAEAGAEGGVEMGMEMTVPDPCAGINPARVCDAESVTCEGENLVVCAATPTGCITRTTMDCTSVPGGSCDATGATPMCVADPCADIEQCDAEARSCTDDTLTVCAADANGCLVETVTDCAADGTICDDSGDTPACVDECDGVSDCDAEGRSCDGETLTVCAPDENGCLVTETTDCAADGGSCDAAGDPVACLPPLCPPAIEFDTALNCGSGTISGNTEGGSTFLSSYSCGFTNYPGPENVYTFSDGSAATVTITAVRTTSTLDMDLYVLPGDAVCGPTTPCLDDSTGSTDTETVEFDYIPGTEALVIYDVFGTAGGTAEYDLTVSCETVTCGDGTIEGPETCEDGNTDNGDGCSEFCVIEPGFLCEVVDDVSVCTPSCGDGVINGDDACDDMNDVDGDGCTACVIDDGFLCDDSEPSVCEPSCGDGLINGPDECDDLNDVDGDGCTACVVDADFACGGEPSVCGGVLLSVDGELEDTDTSWLRPGPGFFLDGPETCADNTAATSAVFESYEFTNEGADDIEVDIVVNFDDFDGYLHVFDAAVDPASPTTGCLTGNDDDGTTRRSAVRGLTVSAGETIFVIVSSFNTGRGPFSLAITESVDACGNGVVNEGEECDDGGTTGAGCAADCTIEDGFACNVTDFVSMCEAACGNGMDDDGEECDDGNDTDADGCTGCTIDDGFLCDASEPSFCEMPVCGNSTVELGEVCDDGNTDSGDGCEADCQSAVFAGSIENTDSQWDRGSGCSFGGDSDHFFDVQPFAWNGAAAADLTFTVAWTGVDGYMHLYTNPFAAGTPDTGCLASSDDFGGTTGSRVSGFEVAAGATIDTVLSTFDPNETGDWTLTITRD